MISDDYQVIYIHIPRTGGHTINMVFNKYGRPHPKVLGGMHSNPSNYIKYFPNKWKEYYKILSIRNPFDRLVSIFSYARRSRFKKIDVNEHFTEIADEFNYMIKNSLHDIAKSKPSIQMVHWLKEGRKEPYPYNKIIRYETFEDDLNEVFEDINCEPAVEIKKYYKSNRKDYKKYYTNETKSLVEKYYAEDLKTFGYSF